MQKMELMMEEGERQLIEREEQLRREIEEDSKNPACIIASACVGKGDTTISALRDLRDNAISTDPIARDLFHVFWSRYYEWSPGVARIAASDPAVARHIQWGFLEPWLAWLEFAARVGRRKVTELNEQERQAILNRLIDRLEPWISEIPALLESKCPPKQSDVFAAFDRFRTAAMESFCKVTISSL